MKSKKVVAKKSLAKGVTRYPSMTVAQMPTTKFSAKPAGKAKVAAKKSLRYAKKDNC